MAEEWTGLIKDCNKYAKECGHKCCSFKGNYIVLYPGEWEKSSLKKDHIKIIDEDYFGGKRAICTKGTECNPTKEFKSLDCRSYPYFPAVDEKGSILFLKGQKCPLTKSELTEHRELVLKSWKSLIKDESVLKWLKKVKLVGYNPV